MAKALDTSVAVKWSNTDEEEKALEQSISDSQKRLTEIKSVKATEHFTTALAEIEGYVQFFSTAQKNAIARAIGFEKPRKARESIEGMDDKAKKYKLSDDAGAGFAGVEWAGTGAKPQKYRDWDETEKGMSWHKSNPNPDPKKAHIKIYPLNPNWKEAGAE